MEETKVLSSPLSQDYRGDAKYLHGKAFIIKRPKYKHLNTEENAIAPYFNSFPVFLL